MSSNRTRNFLIGSAAVITLGLGAGTLAYFNGGMPRAFAANTGPDELNLVPAGAGIVAYANVQGVMASEFRQKLTQVLDGAGKGRQEFQEQTGIDVERDIDAVIAAVGPNASSEAPQEQGFIALRGRFDTTRIEAFVSEKGGQLDEYRGARLLVDRNHDNPARTDENAEDGGQSQSARHKVHPVIALVDANLVIVGNAPAVKGAIDRYRGDGTASITSDGEFVRMLESVDQNSTVWAIGRPRMLGAQAKLGEASDALARIPDVKWFAASGHLNGGLAATFRAEGKDAEAGKNMRDVVQGVLALARLQLDAKPELRPLLDSLQVEGTDAGVALHVTVPGEMIDVLVKQAGALDQHHDHGRARAND